MSHRHIARPARALLATVTAVAIVAGPSVGAAQARVAKTTTKTTTTTTTTDSTTTVYFGTARKIG